MNILLEILPESLKTAFSSLPIERVYELRLRAGAPAIATVAGRSFFLGVTGIVNNLASAITITRTDLDNIIHKASNYSIYAVNEQLKQGFITVRGGVRIGICGELVTERGNVSTIKNISSVNIRVPHEVKGCSYPVLPYIFTKGQPQKTLIISPPGAGKTTFLRDLAWQVSDKYHLLNTLVLDERGEIAANYLGENQLNVGHTTDVLTGCNKSYGFENGIRSMRPDIIITDEIATREDIEMVKLAARSGVIIFASVHAGGLDEIRLKPHFRELIDTQVFDRYVTLVVRETAGVVAGVYDRNLKLLAL